MRVLAAILLCALSPLSASAAPERPDLEAVERQVLVGTNELRRGNGLPPLEANAQLARAAQAFADWMARHDDYGHEADGRSPTQRARAAGYRDCMVAENLSYQMRSRGFGTKDLAERLVSGWARSPGHRRNMLDAEAVDIGIAVAHSDETSRYYAVQLFGRPESMRFDFEVRNESREPFSYRVGDDAFDIPPRAIRRHSVCTDVEVVVGRRGGDRTFRPGRGDRISMTVRGRLEHEPGQKANPR